MMQIISKKSRLAWRIYVRFAEKLPPHEYVTRDIRRHNPGWGDEMFNRTIESLAFYLPTGHRIVLAGMEQYNFFVEAVQSIKSRDGAKIQAFWFCGKLPGKNMVEMWRVQQGKVTRDQRQWGKEWGGGPTRGWKKGHKGKAISVIEKYQ